MHTLQTLMTLAGHLPFGPAPDGGAAGGAAAPFDPTGLATSIRQFIAPFLLLGISIFALTFLPKKQFSNMAGWLVVTFFVGILFYVPNVMEKIMLWGGALLGGTAA